MRLPACAWDVLKMFAAMTWDLVTGADKFGGGR